MHKGWWRFTIASAILIVFSTQCTRPPSAPSPTSGDQEKKAVEKFGVPVAGGPMDAVLLKDYVPDSSLKVPETHPAKARFPVIDVHAHVYAETPQEVAEWVRTMDETGVEMTVVLTDAVGSEFDRLAELYLKPYPGRFQLYCGIDTNNIEDVGFPDRVVQELIRCYGKGARGVGEISDKGWGIGGTQKEPMPREKRLHPDDPRLDPFWGKCAELKLPVNLHIADHPSCWQPLGPHQERTPDFQVFNLHGKDVPGYEELLGRRDRMLARHPGTTVITCHLSNQGNDLAELAKVLDKFPNLMLDISARDYELGRQPRAAVKFLTRYSNRVMFGTDMGREKTVYLDWWRLLESADEFIPGRIWWRYYGLELSPDLLEKLYRANAGRVLNWKK